MRKKKSNDFKIGEIVVYPKHGVGEIIKVKNMEIANIKAKLLVIDKSKNNMFLVYDNFDTILKWKVIYDIKADHLLKDLMQTLTYI